MKNNGGLNWDLYIVLRVEDHPVFEREGADLFCEVPISFTQAASAVKSRYQLEGKALKIPQATQSHKIFRLRNKGVSQIRRPERGDLHVRAVIETPTNLTSKQKELLAEFEECCQKPAISSSISFSIP